MQDYIIFTDIAKYSTLEDDELKLFHGEIMPIIFEHLKEYQDNAIFWNTWGDAIVAVYDKAEIAINMALIYRDAFRKINFTRLGLNKLRPRIAGNFGEFEILFDPALGKDNVHGTTINQTARIEPITIPGEIFVSKTFRNEAMKTYDFKDICRFDDMGEVTLPKKAGKLYLYRLCRISEERIRPVGKTAFTYYVPITTKEDKRRQEEERKKQEELRKKQEEERKRQEEKLLKIREKEKLVKSIIKETAKDHNNANKHIKKKFDASLEKNTSDKENSITKNPVVIAFILFIGAMLINRLLTIGFIKIMTPELLIVFSPWSSLIGVFLASWVLSSEIMKFNQKVFSSQNALIITGLFILMQFLLNHFYYSSVPLNVLELMAESIFSFLGIGIAKKNYIWSNKLSR